MARSSRNSPVLAYVVGIFVIIYWKWDTISRDIKIDTNNKYLIGKGHCLFGFGQLLKLVSTELSLNGGEQFLARRKLWDARVDAQNRFLDDCCHRKAIKDAIDQFIYLVSIIGAIFDAKFVLQVLLVERSMFM